MRERYEVWVPVLSCQAMIVDLGLAMVEAGRELGINFGLMGGRDSNCDSISGYHFEAELLISQLNWEEENLAPFKGRKELIQFLEERTQTLFDQRYQNKYKRTLNPYQIKLDTLQLDDGRRS